jgi:hypothetical protein
MKVFPIESPLDGEQVVGLHPDRDSLTDKDWRRRVNNFSGRSLTHIALRTEQAGRSGRISALGQLLSPGVISGLVADLSVETNGSEQKHFINVGKGSGVDASGEIVTLNKPLTVDLLQIPVYAPVTLLDAAGAPDATGETVTEAVKDLASIEARKIGPSLGDVIAAGITLPAASILVLQPVQIEVNLQQQQDPCELDPEQYAYENWQLIDGARLLLYSWPDEVISLPGQSAQRDWRNRVAHSIFSLERNLKGDEQMPWTQQGVALAVVGLNADGSARFVDRNAVVRAGGKRRRARSLLNSNGNRFLWQAGFEQFNEQLVDVLHTVTDESVEVMESAAHFRHLPPVGVLPRRFIDLDSRNQQFFPLSYQVDALAVPYEQLDVVVQESASLAPYDFNRPDNVQVLVPVPQVYYHPDLLQTEVIAAEFDTTIDSFVVERDDWLGRRLELRRKASFLRQAMFGEPIEFASPDPESVDTSELASPFETALIEAGDIWRISKGLDALPADWASSGFDDSGWAPAAGGFGFSQRALGTNLEDMPGAYTSVNMRLDFMLDDVETERNYRLEVETNGGFIAFLNGKEIARFNQTDNAFDALADERIDQTLQVIELGNLAGSVVAGTNVLAIQAHSSALSAQSFGVLPGLVERHFVDLIEKQDFGLSVETDSDGLAVLNDAEPVYQIDALEELKTFFNNRTYRASDGTSKRIWSKQDIDRFEQVETEGLEEFIEFLNDKINKANDKVDFGFIRLQTDIYRIRQFMLGSEQATKLATSPVLAGIAKGNTAGATKEEINNIASLLSAQRNTSAGASADEGNINLSERASTETTARARSFNTGSSTFVSSVFSGNDFGLPGSTFEDTIKGQDRSIQNIIRDSSGRAGILSNETLVLEQETSTGGLFLNDKTIKARDIEEQSSIVGAYPVFRNVTVGERLEQPVTQEAVDSGLATKAETISNILTTGLSMDGIFVPGFKDQSNGADIELHFKDIDSAVLGDILGGKHDPVDREDEASRFNTGVRAMENASALLRLTEGRIKTYRSMISESRKTLQKMNGSQSQLDKRLKQIEQALAEARHDVSVARALKAEEQERIDSVNQSRTAILEEHVPFLLFRRPRHSDTIVDTPVMALNPDLSELPMPVCNVDEEETPEEIAALMDEIREAPVKWFTASSKLMKKINRPTDLNNLIKGARARAINRTTRHRLINRQFEGINRLAAGIHNSLQSFHRVIELQRKQVASVDLVQFNRSGWKEGRKRAAEVISLGDVIDGNHGRMGVSRLAAQELEQMSRAAVCLYLQFVQILPSIRLDWAEKLSQFDTPFNLRNLHSLPRWNEIDFIERNQMQRLVDGLFGRIDTAYSDASNMINDLIRISLLLASHAPVNRLISGLVPEPKAVRPGSVLDIIADLSRVRIGMNIALVSGRNTVARGRVSDIVGGRIKSEIISTVEASVNIDRNVRVQIGEPRFTGGKPYKPINLFLKR